MSERPVLLADDGRGTATRAVAEQLARDLGVPLAVAVAYRYDGVSLSARQGTQVADARRERAAERQADRIVETFADDLEVRARAVPARNAAEAIGVRAVELDATAIVLGPDREGHVVRDVLRRAGCPVVVAPDELGATAPSGAIGVALDGSPTSRAAYAAGHRLARATGGRLVLIAVERRGRDERLRDAVAAAAEMASVDVETQVRLRSGDVVEELRAVSRELDVLCVGHRGLGAMRSALLGSVSAGLVADPACPTLVVPSGADRRSARPLGVTTAART